MDGIILIKNARTPGEVDIECDILVKDGKISSVMRDIRQANDMTVVDAAGCVAAPGLVDMHVHFRDPGMEYKEDILTGAAAAAAGGVTTCCCMPNTLPVADNADVIEYILKKAKSAPVTVLPYGAVTHGQSGRELTDFAALKLAGAAGLSDDGNPVQSAEVMRLAMRSARGADMLLISHCEDADMVRDFAVNEGRVSAELGIHGRPAVAEEIMVARDVMLAAETGARVHIAHVSTARSVEIIRRAKETGIRVTAETCPQYFALTEEEIARLGSLARVNPPLRTGQDADAIIAGLADGTIDVIATDHAPHSAEEKSKPLVQAPSGMIGLETSLGLALTFLYHTGKLGMDKLMQLMSVNPARILGLEAGTLNEGAAANIVIFDPHEEWTVDPNRFKSKARNTPFAGLNLRGKVKYTISSGEIVYRD